MENQVEIRNLSMNFPIKNTITGEISGYVHALDGINLDIRKNEILGLVGESGSGKSTLGNCILKLITPSKGEVLFESENILKKKKNELKPFRKKTGIIFQNPFMSLNPRMKIYDMLKEPLIIHGIKDKKTINETIEKILKLTGFEDEILNAYPHEFSGGQRQRLAIARAIITNPEFLVADEPVSALDVSIQAQIINMLADLKNKLNFTMLFISHDLSVVKYISDRIAVMYLGEIVELADKTEFFDNYKHPYSKALLSSLPALYGNPPEEKVVLHGDLPSPSDPPKGCKLHNRCPFAFDKCKCVSPELKEVSKGHFVRCFLSEQ